MMPTPAAIPLARNQVEGLTPTVTHRSVRGHPSGDGGAKQRFQRFAFNHQEVFPAPTESSTWRLGGAGANRVFEVWGCSPESGSSGGPGQAEALLGLAKVSLRPFAAFEGRTGDSRLAVGADGPVSVVDPFSGKAVGDLHLLLALGASPTIAALAGKGGDAEAGSGAMGDPSTLGGGSNAKGGRETGNEQGDRELEDEGGAGLRGGPAGGAEGEGGGGMVHAAEPPALDDSVAGEDSDVPVEGGGRGGGICSCRCCRLLSVDVSKSCRWERSHDDLAFGELYSGPDPQATRATARPPPAPPSLAHSSRAG